MVDMLEAVLRMARAMPTARGEVAPHDDVMYCRKASLVHSPCRLMLIDPSPVCKLPRRCPQPRASMTPGSWTMVVSAEGLSSLLEGGTQYVADSEDDVLLYTRYISGSSLEEQILAPASLEDFDSGLVVAEQVEQLVFELWCPQVDGQSYIERLEVTDRRVGPEYPRRKGSMVRSASCEGSTARHAGINVELYRVPVILVNDESVIHVGEEPIDPC